MQSSVPTRVCVPSFAWTDFYDFAFTLHAAMNHLHAAMKANNTVYVVDCHITAQLPALYACLFPPEDLHSNAGPHPTLPFTHVASWLADTRVSRLTLTCSTRDPSALHHAHTYLTLLHSGATAVIQYADLSYYRRMITSSQITFAQVLN